MSKPLYINVAASDPRAALIRGVAATQPASGLVFTQSDNIPLDVFLCDGQGGYDASSGNAGYSLRVGIGLVGGAPDSGTYTLTDGSATTAALSYNANAAAVQAALNALNTNTGPSSGLVTVTGTFPTFKISWNANGSRAQLSGADATNLLVPDTSIVVNTLTDGDGSTKEIQLLRLRRRPAVFQDTWTLITNGWRGRLNFGTFSMAALLGSEPRYSSYFEVEVRDGSGRPITYCQIPVTVLNELIDETALVETPMPSTDYYTGIESDGRYVLNESALTGLTGGGGTKLDGIETAAGATPSGALAAVLVSGFTYFYRLESGTDAENSPLVIRPDDYASSTNEQVWKLYGSAPVLNSVTRATISFSTSLSVNMDGARVQQMTATDDFTITTDSATRAASGKSKSVLIEVLASGADRTVDIDSDIVPYSEFPLTIPQDTVCVVDIQSDGPNETDTKAVAANQFSVGS